MGHFVVDATHLLCPLPVIRVQARIATLQAGDTLEVICSDPGALYDVPAWCRINGHRILETREHDRRIVLLIEVGERGVCTPAPPYPPGPAS